MEHCHMLIKIFQPENLGAEPCPRVVQWLDDLGAMCSTAWRALCAIGSRFNSSRSPGKERLLT